jgi:hypothetical protein
MSQEALVRGIGTAKCDRIIEVISIAKNSSNFDHVNQTITAYILGFWSGINTKITVDRNDIRTSKHIPYSAQNALDAVVKHCYSDRNAPLFTHLWNMYLEF